MSILGLACGAYLETGRSRFLPMAGIVFSIVAGLMTFFIIWNVFDESTPFIKSTATATLLALSCSHLSLLSLARLDRRFAWSRIAAFVCVWLLSAILLFLMWFEPEATGDTVSRIIGVLAILIATVTVITPVFHKLSVNESDIVKIDAEIAQLKARIKELELKRSKCEANSQQAD